MSLNAFVPAVPPGKQLYVSKAVLRSTSTPFFRIVGLDQDDTYFVEIKASVQLLVPGTGYRQVGYQTTNLLGRVVAGTHAAQPNGGNWSYYPVPTGSPTPTPNMSLSTLPQLYSPATRGLQINFQLGSSELANAGDPGLTVNVLLTLISGPSASLVAI